MEAVKTSFDAVLGAKVESVWTDAEHSQLGFKTDKGVFVFHATGDCCSRSWFEHFSGTEALIGHTVNAIIEHECTDLSDAEKHPDSDVERKYGWTFETNRGRADLDMRNDSNGYYGGEAKLAGKYDWHKLPNSLPPIEVREDF